MYVTSKIIEYKKQFRNRSEEINKITLSIVIYAEVLKDKNHVFYYNIRKVRCTFRNDVSK